MRILRSAPYALGASVVAALLWGCSGSGEPQSSALAPAAGMNASRSSPRILGHLTETFVAVKSYTVHSDHRRSWFSPDGNRARQLLFVSDVGTNDVDIFTIPGMQLEGVLTGFSEPQGECSDASGNVWITNTGADEILQYSHTGSLLAALSDPTGYATGCAVDPTTGNLAVTNYTNFSSGPGEVLIYPHATGSPSHITNPSQYSYYFIGYDDSGNLCFDGRDANEHYILSCAATTGGGGVKTVSLRGGTLYFPGLVQYDRLPGRWALGDQFCGDVQTSCVYTASISGGNGIITAKTNLKNYSGRRICDMVQGVIAASGPRYIAGGDYESCARANTSVERWAFPAGGTPTNYNDTVMTEPLGAAISKQ